MIRLTYESKILFAIRAIDFRKGIDGLVGLCRNHFVQDPSSGAIYVFINRSKTMIRILHYDGTGYWLMTKRLSRGRYPWWPRADGDTMSHIQAERLALLLAGRDPCKLATLKDS